MAKTSEKIIHFNVGGKTKIDRVERVISPDKKDVEIKVITKTKNNKSDRVESEVDEEFDRKFPIIEASKLFERDDFMNHEPITLNQKRIKNTLEKIREVGAYDFRVACMDPSLDKDGNIVFEEGKTPAVRHYTTWWEKHLEAFMPEKGSRMGTTEERDIFLGSLIKYLVEEEGYEVSEAWKAICEDSRDLAYYTNSKNAIKREMEPTGSRKVGQFYDLGNIYKIVKDVPAREFVFSGGLYSFKSYDAPLATRFTTTTNHYADDFCKFAVGWLVMDV